MGRATWRALLAYVRPHWGTIVVGGALGLIGSAAGLAQPLAAKTLVQQLGERHPIVGALVLLTVLVLVGAGISAVGNYLLQRTAETVVLDARRHLIRHLIRLRIPEVERNEPGDLMSRVTSDTTLLREVTTQSVVSSITGALTLIAIVVLMGIMDPLLLAVTAAVIVLVGLIVGLVMPRIAKATRRAQEAVGEIGATLERMLGAFRTVKASGAEARERAVVEDAAERSWQAGLSAAKWQSLVGIAAGLAIQISFLAVLGVGGAQVAKGDIGVATLVAFLLYLFYLMGPIGQLVRAVSQLQVGAAAMARIADIDQLEVEPESPAATGGTSPATVRFDGVRFRYREELPEVHHGVTFDVPAGGMTAFVGPSGAGKSTVFALIERFYEATGGRVLIDGRDVLDWPLGELRASIGYVEQDAPVLSGSLRDNLRFAAPDVTDEDIRRVLAQTRLDGLVERLPEGLDTVVGHRGSKLSGGERQRVAIARALLRRPRLLLLDEVTSQLDALNEMALREVVAEAARSTTVLVVAHRLSTVTRADRIVVMDAGEVRAVGTHAELVRGDDLYRELATTQFLAMEGAQAVAGQAKP
ncbi:MAG TPA: ABC transporter ATP-binding protein [Candidatus Dormibacteraeota bacterium]|nr:ABC transporter ATP-binding protein [Candidatus Dormibacteraeota bacterium]